MITHCVSSLEEQVLEAGKTGTFINIVCKLFQCTSSFSKNSHQQHMPVICLNSTEQKTFFL